MKRVVKICLAGAAVALSTTSNGFAWAPVAGHMMTKYADSVNPNSVWPEYPRPQLVRSVWINLNGLWNYVITADQTSEPPRWEGQILVPFPLESSLSGVGRPLRPEQTLWYKR